MPRLWIRDWTALEEPLPTAIRTITEATPIVMPRIVRPERSLFAVMPPQAIRSVSRPIIAEPRRRVVGGLLLQRNGGAVVHADGAAVLDHAAVAERDHALGLLGDVGLVGDQHDRAAFLVEAREDPQHLLGGARVEVAGRLVGEDHRRVGDERARDGDALLLAAGELGGLVVEPLRHPDRGERLVVRARGARGGRRRRRRAAVRRSRARSCGRRG